MHVSTLLAFDVPIGRVVTVWSWVLGGFFTSIGLERYAAVKFCLLATQFHLVSRS